MHQLFLNKKISLGIEYTSANMKAWDEVANIHKNYNFKNLKKSFGQAGYSCLDKIETEILYKIGLHDKTICQLCCNNGRELLSIKNMGAKRCVGFDISAHFIKQARELSVISETNCEFICVDVYNIPPSFNFLFDLVYITVGSIAWMPNLKVLFQIIVNLLKKGGRIFIYDMHPILDMFKAKDNSEDPKAKISYFRRKPFLMTNGLDYYSKKSYDSFPMYRFHHKMSDIISECIKNNFYLEFFQEYDHCISKVFEHFGNIKAKLPLRVHSKITLHSCSRI